MSPVTRLGSFEFANCQTKESDPVVFARTKACFFLSAHRETSCAPVVPGRTRFIYHRSVQRRASCIHWITFQFHHFDIGAFLLKLPNKLHQPSLPLRLVPGRTHQHDAPNQDRARPQHQDRTWPEDQVRARS